MVRHLQMRILSGHQSTGELESLPYLDQNPLHH